MGFVRQARVSFLSFSAGISLCFYPVIFKILPFIGFLWTDFWHGLIMIHLLACNGIFSAVYVHQKDSYNIAVRAGNLGLAFSVGFLLAQYSTFWQHFGWYVMGLSFFHWSEYQATALTNPKALSLESFLLDHSREYKLAAAASCIEFIVEGIFFQGIKQLRWISVIGAIMTVGGEGLRKLSMFTAQSNFNHHIQHTRKDGHVLVTHGVYRFFRHPSYVGWFAWSVGTQIMMCNPICLTAYAIVSWRFFDERIYDEEICLLNFFGEDYLDYQKKVPTGIPFVKGYQHVH